MNTVRELIKGAMRLINVGGQASPLTPEDFEAGLYALDTMTDSWSNEKLMIYSINPYIFCCVAGQKQYTLGPARTNPGAVTSICLPLGDSCCNSAGNPGSGYADGYYPNVTASYVGAAGAGTGLVVNVTVNLGSIVDIQIVSPGINYQVGDLLTVDTGQIPFASDSLPGPFVIEAASSDPPDADINITNNFGPQSGAYGFCAATYVSNAVATLFGGFWSTFAGVDGGNIDNSSGGRQIMAIAVSDDDHLLIGLNGSSTTENVPEAVVITTSGGTQTLHFADIVEAGVGGDGNYYFYWDTLDPAIGAAFTGDQTVTFHFNSPTASFGYDGPGGWGSVISSPGSISLRQAYLTPATNELVLAFNGGYQQDIFTTVTFEGVGTFNSADADYTGGGCDTYWEWDPYGQAPWTPGQQYTISFTPANTAFTFSPCSVVSQTDWVIERPMKIEAAYTIWNSGQQEVDIPIKLLTMEQYAAASVKNTPSTFPFGLYDNGNYPVRTITVFPVPTNSVPLRLWLRMPLIDASYENLDLPVDYPPGYERAFRYNLAIELAPEYGKTVTPEVLRIAQEAKDQLKQQNQAPQFKMGDGGLSRNSGFFNWITGNFGTFSNF